MYHIFYNVVDNIIYH